MLIEMTGGRDAIQCLYNWAVYCCLLGFASDNRSPVIILYCALGAQHTMSAQLLRLCQLIDNFHSFIFTPSHTATLNRKWTNMGWEQVEGTRIYLLLMLVSYNSHHIWYKLWQVNCPGIKRTWSPQSL